MMTGMFGGIIRTVLRFTGLATYWNMLTEKPWMAVVLVIALALTCVWIIRFFPKVASGLGKTIGGLSMGFLMVAIGIGIMLGIVHMLAGMGTSMIVGAFGGIPVIGPPIARAANWLLGILLNFIIAIAIGVYILKNMATLPGKIMDVITGSAKAWKVDEGETGLNKVKWSYVIFGILPIGLMICHPGLNDKSYFAPAILTSIAGIASIFFTKARTKRIVDRTGARMMHKPRAEDDAWTCIAHGVIPQLDKQGKPKRNPETGKVIGKKGNCKGPQGKDENGNPYNGWNPRTALHCLSPLCDQENPYFYKCEACEYDGKDHQLIPRDPKVHVKCPKCEHTHGPVKARTKFHLPHKDKHNIKTHQARVAKRRQADSSARPAAGACASCGAELSGTAFCTSCGTKVGASAPASKPAAASSPATSKSDNVIPITRAKKKRKPGLVAPFTHKDMFYK